MVPAPTRRESFHTYDADSASQACRSRITWSRQKATHTSTSAFRATAARQAIRLSSKEDGDCLLGPDCLPDFLTASPQI
jgi:hypothetical protein